MSAAGGPRVCVVGGGALGSAAAWALARRGAEVRLVERFEAGHTRGGSHGSARIFRLAYDTPDYVRLAASALPLWRSLEAEAGTGLLDTTGGVDHGDPVMLHAVGAALRSCAAPFAMLTPSEASERWPGMRFDGEVLYQPDAGRVNADAALAALQRVATKLGAELRFGERALAVRERAGGVEVETTAATRAADVAVLAAGAWTRALAGGPLGLPPMTVTEQHPAHFLPHDEGTAWPSFVHHRPGRHAMYGLAAPGAEGVKVGQHGGGRAVDPDARPRQHDAAALEQLSEYVRDWLPGLDAQPTSWAACVYDSTPSEDFVVDRRGRVVIAAGTSGHGFKFVPALGEMIAALALGQEQTLARFRLPSGASARTR